VPDCAVECRIVRGILVGDAAVDLDLWGFCGDAAAREATPPEISRQFNYVGRMLVAWTDGRPRGTWQSQPEHPDGQLAAPPVP
jgi:hypothetical protein